MSIAAIIIGLIVWFSLPEFVAPRLNDKWARIARLACKWIGIATIAGGVIYGFF